MKEVADFLLKDLGFNVRRTGRPLTSVYNKMLSEKEFNLECTQYHLLIILASSSHKLSSSAIGSMLFMDRTTVSRSMQHLIDKDLVYPTYKKSKVVSGYILSNKGEKVVKEVIPILNQIDTLIKADEALIKGEELIGNVRNIGNICNTLLGAKEKE